MTDPTGPAGMSDLFSHPRRQWIRGVIMTNKANVIRVLQAHATEIAPVLDVPLDRGVTILDLSAANRRLADLDVTDPQLFETWTKREVARQGARVAIGGYGEDRVVYRSPLFQAGGEARTVHLGIDIWAEYASPVYSPLPARVHSFRDNANSLDYGPTVILSHRLEGVEFYTLYGHLTRQSLDGLSPGVPLSRGMAFARVGAPEENGGWPSHLHFQIITDMEGRWGDFPGVAPASEKTRWLELCPDPNLILQCPALGYPAAE